MCRTHSIRAWWWPNKQFITSSSNYLKTKWCSSSLTPWPANSSSLRPKHPTLLTKPAICLPSSDRVVLCNNKSHRSNKTNSHHKMAPSLIILAQPTNRCKCHPSLQALEDNNKWHNNNPYCKCPTKWCPSRRRTMECLSRWSVTSIRISATLANRETITSPPKYQM